ncbi:hypothetical protein COU93_02170, partial [Candidatus Shapirobacteria bacterium CG10_big_fil_rev_8_21_14_0_10_36_6]
QTLPLSTKLTKQNKKRLLLKRQLHNLSAQITNLGRESGTTIKPVLQNVINPSSGIILNPQGVDMMANLIESSFNLGQRISTRLNQKWSDLTGRNNPPEIIQESINSTSNEENIIPNIVDIPTPTSLSEINTLDDLALYLYDTQTKSKQSIRLYYQDKNSSNWLWNRQVSVPEFFQNHFFLDEHYYLYDGTQYVSLYDLFQKVFKKNQSQFLTYRTASESESQDELLNLLSPLWQQAKLNEVRQLAQETNGIIVEIPNTTISDDIKYMITYPDVKVPPNSLKIYRGINTKTSASVSNQVGNILRDTLIGGVNGVDTPAISNPTILDAFNTFMSNPTRDDYLSLVELLKNHGYPNQAEKMEDYLTSSLGIDKTLENYNQIQDEHNLPHRSFAEALLYLHYDTQAGAITASPYLSTSIVPTQSINYASKNGGFIVANVTPNQITPYNHEIAYHGKLEQSNISAFVPLGNIKNQHVVDLLVGAVNDIPAYDHASKILPQHTLEQIITQNKQEYIDFAKRHLAQGESTEAVTSLLINGFIANLKFRFAPITDQDLATLRAQIVEISSAIANNPDDYNNHPTYPWQAANSTTLIPLKQV